MAFGKKSPSQAGAEESPSGLKAELTSFLQDASAYLKLRGELFTIEAKEAGQTYGKKVGLVVAGGVLMLLAYLLILVAMIGIIATTLDSSSELTFTNWIGATLILAAVHLLAGFLIFRKGRKIGVDQELFEYTRSEIQNEQQWLKHKRKP